MKKGSDADIGVFSGNLTHNLTRMASECGLYEAIWRPEEIGAVCARDIVNLLDDGIGKLKGDPDRYKAMNPPNGWGCYDVLLDFAVQYLKACQDHPYAAISVCR